MCSAQKAYVAIGKAVIASQVFEVTFVSIFEFFKMLTKPEYLLKTNGFIAAGSFKVPIKSVVKVLSEKGQIDSKLEEKLTEYVENRNILIHRWVQEYGWPSEDNTKEWEKVKVLANRVEKSAIELTNTLSSYMVKYAELKWAKENRNKYQDKMRAVFQNSH